MCLLPCISCRNTNLWDVCHWVDISFNLVGSAANGDDEIKIIADKIFKTGRQIVEHPLSV